MSSRGKVPVGAIGKGVPLPGALKAGPAGLTIPALPPNFDGVGAGVIGFVIVLVLVADLLASVGAGLEGLTIELWATLAGLVAGVG